MTSVFLSYARGDDGESFDPATSFVARLHRDLTAAGLAVWFDRMSMPSRTLTFHQEIRDAVAACDRLVLVVGPKAAESLYVRQEWQFAYFEAEKIVTPILRRGDYSNVPDELKLLHCEDFRDDGQYDLHLKNLIRQLAEPAPVLGKLIGVPSLPPHFLSRTERLTALRDALRADLDRPVVITGAAARVGMHGMGGIGKSVLAATLSRDRKVREAFPDGIVWVGLGPLPTVADLQRRVHKDLGGDGAFQTEHEGRVKLRDILKDKGVLLILDDIWRREDVDWFDVLGPRCRAMLTTRDAGLLTSLGGVHHQVELLTDAEALNLLAQAAGLERDKLPSEAADLIAECGRLPLAVALCGGMLKRGVSCQSLIQRLSQAALETIADRQGANEQHRSVWAAMKVSVDALSAEDRQRFVELSVFPNNETVSEAAVCTLWSHTGCLNEIACEDLLISLNERSLVQLSQEPATAGQPARRRIALHNLLNLFATRLAESDIGDAKTRDNLVLAAYAKICPDGWHVDPPNDGYFLTHLRQHLIAAGRAGELADLLLELRWLEAKNEARLTFDLTADFAEAMRALPETDARQRNLRLLDEALRRDIHFIARHAKDYPQAMFQCLWNQAWWYDCREASRHYEPSLEGSLTHSPPWEEPGRRLAVLLESWRILKETATPGFRWLRSHRPPSVHLGTAQKSIIHGHQGSVNSVAISPDGQRIITGSSDKTVRIWDARSGAELYCLRGHEGYGNSVAISANGRYVVSGAIDNTVRVWDATSGVEVYCLRGHESFLHSVAISPDGQRIVSASHDWTLRVWDTASRAELYCLRGLKAHKVVSVAFSPDGQRFVSGSWDQTLRVWNTASGSELCCLCGHEDHVNSVAFSPDGLHLVSGSADHTVRLWDIASGAELCCMRGHENSVRSVAFSPDGQRIVSGSDDTTVSVWNASSSAELHCLLGHEFGVYSVAFFPDGKRLVSGSFDHTVRIWDTASDTEFRWLRGCRTGVYSAAFSPDGQRLVTGSDQTVRVWDTASATELSCLCGHNDQVLSVAFSPDSQRIASCGSSDKTARVWDANTGAELCCLRGHERDVNSVVFSPDCQRIASGSSDKTARVWDATTGAELCCLRGHERHVNSVAFSPDGQRVVSGSSDWTVRVWDVNTSAELLCLRQEDVVNSVAFSPDGLRIISVQTYQYKDGIWSPNKAARSWDAASGICLEEMTNVGVGDVVAISKGARHFPFRAMLREFLETVIKSSNTGEAVAWFPVPLNLITHPSGLTWTAKYTISVCVITLEGSV